MAWQRAYKLVVGPIGSLAATLAQSIDVSNLRITFRVKKTLKPQPNHADIRVWNLNTFSQALLENSAALACSLEAGYKDEGMFRVYLGEIRTADTKQHGPDYVTKMVTDDKGRKLQKVHINVPIRAGSPIEDVIRLILGSFNGTGAPSGTVGEGNLKKAMEELKKFGLTSLHPRGGLLAGNAAQELTDLCKGANLEWSIQDGNLFLLPVGKAWGKASVVLNSNTGLLKSPMVDNEGFITAESLMIPGIYPGSVVIMESKFKSGAYRVTEVEYHGDTHGVDWFCKIKGEKHG